MLQATEKKHLSPDCVTVPGMPVDFQGVDVRIMTDEMADALSGFRHKNQIHIAWDMMNDEKQVLSGIDVLLSYVKPYRVMCYVLVGFDTTPDQDLYRIEKLRGLGIDPFVMKYRQNDYTKKVARWCNHKAIFKSVSFDEYRSGVRKTSLA